MRRFVMVGLWACLAGLPGCAVDANKLPRTYLVQAQDAVMARDTATALAALDRAQALWISANTRIPVPGVPYDPEALRDMGFARAALTTGRLSDAAYWIRTAIAQPSVTRPGQL